MSAIAPEIARPPRAILARALPTRDALYDEFQPLVRRLIRQYGQSEEMRQELVGEIYYRFCRILEAYDPDRGVPLRPYLVRKLTASVYTFACAKWRSSVREIPLDDDSALPAELTQDPTRQWDDALEQRARMDGLPCALRQLSDRQRNALVWRYFDGLGYEEIAVLLDVRVPTVRSHLRHAIERLREALSPAD